MSDQPEIHPSHNPEQEDAPRLYASGIACRRCGRFVAFDETAASGARITMRGQQPCEPVRITFRDVIEGVA